MLWKNWKTIKSGNYLYAKLPEHPNADSHGYVLEHRVVMENKIGRILEKDEQVHHIDENGKNNDPDNLKIMMKGEHQRFHSTKYKDGHFIDLVCDYCGKSFSVGWNQRPVNQEKTFCSRSCNGKFYWNGGFNMTDEIRKKMSESGKKRKTTEETKMKLSISMKRVWQERKKK